MTYTCTLCIGAFTWSTSGVQHGNCSTVHGPMFPDSIAEEEIGWNPSSHQENTKMREKQDGLWANTENNMPVTVGL